MATNILLVLHLILAVTIVILVLLQQGKGSDMGSAFGGGSSQSLFGAQGGANFLSRMTSTLVATFFITSLVLAFMYTRQGEQHSVLTGSVLEQSNLPQGIDNLNDIPADSAVPTQPENQSEDDIPATPQ